MDSCGWKRPPRKPIPYSPSFVAAAVLLFSCTDSEAHVSAAAPAQQIRIGHTVEKMLPVGSVHSYRLNLAAGQHLRIEVDQAPQHFYLRIYEPAGVQIADGGVYCQQEGACTVPFFAERNGPHRLELRSSAIDFPEYAADRLDVTYKLRVVAASAEQSKEQREALREAISWLQASSYPVETVEPGSGFQDLLPLRSVVADARLVGLGEGTHGTREFFQVKHRLLEFLVREMGFTHLAMEVDQGAAEEINDFVMLGSGDPAAAFAAAGAWQWGTDEVTAMLHWMRDYNRTVPEDHRVAFVGFDFQMNDRGREELLAFLRRVAPERVPATNLVLAPLVRRPDPSRRGFVEFYSYSTEQKARTAAEVRALFDYLEANRDCFVRSTSAAEFEKVLHAARRMVQFTDAHSRPGYEQDRPDSGVATRDRYMAENIYRLLQRGGANAKIAIWSHNEHVRRDPYSMGYYLGQRYGAGYYALGLAFDRGGFRALEITGKSPAPLKSFTLPPAVQSSVGWYMKRAGKGDTFVDLRHRPQTGPAAEWFSRAHPMRSIGNGYAPSNPTGYFRAPAVLGGSYDGIIFIEQTTPARGKRH